MLYGHIRTIYVFPRNIGDVELFSAQFRAPLHTAEAKPVIAEEETADSGLRVSPVRRTYMY